MGEKHQSYLDDPYATMRMIASLKEEDAYIYTLGYVQACEHVLESFIDTKNKLLGAVLEAETEEISKRLLTHVRLLDMLEKSISERVALVRANLLDKNPLENR